ncbi:zinc finger and SCAN domain-containing protein 21-like isoform X3 [Dreissena polymorpha]|uniref:zinc finger and SCAN domain-containing protein 21-like isoform X3 n=1 Tax=Dreissena polymorpha TaxID=45954 RepID=UPI002263E803|nr:zinc finger and SCAN domain-containing protein 21-like isoform X3 [Dreissena polymorpha]XP_052251444.1 zinc finger and SCAN domain-containing protein 21-like isoform X3 [Dreissena polymorpha]
MASSMDVIKDIPGYKVILKAVLKTQIQQLVEQLAEHTDEESVILTASVADGTLSHLGSESGKSYLDDHEDVKSSFLGFCLKRHHRRKQLEKEQEQEREREKLQAQIAQAQAQAQMQAQMQASMRPGPRRGAHGPYFPGPRQATPRHQPYPLSRPRGSSGDFNTSNSQDQTMPGQSMPGVSPFRHNKVKQETAEGQSGGENPASDNEQSNSSGSNLLNEGVVSVGDNLNMSGVSVKTEAGDSEDLEITGVELGMGSQSQEGWDPSVSMATGMNFDPGSATEGGGEMASQSGYNLAPAPGVGVSSVTGEGQFKCSLCGKVLTSKWKLENEHMRTHTGERPFRCDTCGKAFSLRGNLTKHMVIHYAAEGNMDFLL